MNLLFSVFIAAGSCFTGSCIISADIVKEELVRYLVSKEAGTKQSDIESKDAQKIIRTHLDKTLLVDIVDIKGSDFRFTPIANSDEAQVAVLVLTYPDETMAQQRAEKLAAYKGYFKNTKILTRFSYWATKNQISIAFTESAGSQKVVDFVDGLPKRAAGQ